MLWLKINKVQDLKDFLEKTLLKGDICKKLVDPYERLTFSETFAENQVFFYEQWTQ